MTTIEAVQHFGSKADLARALKVTNGSITQWGEEPPPARQWQIQVLSKGKLKVSPSAKNKRDS